MIGIYDTGHGTNLPATFGAAAISLTATLLTAMTFVLRFRTSKQMILVCMKLRSDAFYRESILSIVTGRPTMCLAHRDVAI
jgi:hypothetical protein